MSKEPTARQRLRAELAAAPRGTKARLAKHLGVRPEALTRMTATKGEVREITADEAAKIAAFFNRNRVPVVGYVGAGGSVVYADPLDGEDTVPRPPDAPPETVAAAIRGVSLGAGFDRWYALYARREDPVTENLIGQLCVVGTADGRTLVKWLRQGRGKAYNLVSGTGEIEENVRLLWAAKVIHMHQP